MDYIFGMIGFIFGIVGLSLAGTAMAKVSALEKEVEKLKSQIGPKS